MDMYYDDEYGWIINGESQREREEATKPLTYEQMTDYGIIDPAENQKQIQQTINEGEVKEQTSPSFIDKAGKALQKGVYAIDEFMGDYHRPTDREYKKLSVGDTFKDIGKAVKTEASHIFQKKENEYNYDPETKAGEVAQYLYRYGVGMLPFIGAGKILKGVKGLQGLGKLLTGEYKAIEALKKSDKFLTRLAGRAAAGSLAGTNAGALAGFILSRPEEHEETLFDILPDNILSSNDEDNKFEYKLKHGASDLIGGLVGGAVMDTAVFPILKYTLGKPVNALWGAFKKLVKSKGKEAVEAAAREVVEADLNANTAIKNTKFIGTLQKVLDDTGINDIEELRRYLKEKDIAYDPIALQEIFPKLQKGQTVIAKEDGTFSIFVTKYQDAADVSLEELAQQTENNGITLMNEAVEDVWKERGWLQENQKIFDEIKNSKGLVKTKTNKTVADNIADNYKNKWGIDEKIKIIFENGTINGAEATTERMTRNGKIVGITIRINKNTPTPYAVLRSELEHARDMSKGVEPKNPDVKHFDRYEGKNESEMSLRYVKKKADKRATKTTPIEGSKIDKNTTEGINTPTEAKTLENEPQILQGGKAVNTRVKGDYTYSDEKISVKGKDYDVIRVKNAKGETTAHVRYSMLGDNSIFINTVQNYGIEKGAGRLAVKDLMEKYPDSKIFWEAINEVSAKSYQHFIKEYPELAKRINFQDRSLIPQIKSEEDFYNFFDTFENPKYNKGNEGLINEGSNKNNTGDVQSNISREGVEVGETESGGNQRTVNTGKSDSMGKTSQMGENEPSHTAIDERGEAPVNINREPIASDFAQSKTIGDILDLTTREGELAKYEKVNWEKRAISADKLEEFFDKFDFRDNTAIKRAINQNDIEHLNYTANACLVLAKKNQELRNELINAVTVAERREILTAMSSIQQTLDAVGSMSGNILQARKFLHKVENVFALTEAEELGKTSFIDALNTEIKKLNFTENKPDYVQKAEEVIKGLSQHKPQIMQSLMNKPELYDDFMESLVKLLRRGEPSRGQLEGLIEDVIIAKEVNRAAYAVINATDEGLWQAVRNTYSWTSYYLSNLLSSPMTHTRNIVSGLSNTVLVPLEKAVGALFSPSQRHLATEAKYQYICLADNFKEAMKLAIQTFKTGEGQLVQLGKDTVVGEGKKQIQRMGDINPFNNPQQFTSNENVNIVLQTLKNFLELPLRFLGAEDEFMTQWYYRTAVQSKAMIQAEKEAITQGLTGETKKAFIKQKASEGVQNAFTSSGKAKDVIAYAEAREAMLQTPLNGKYWDYENNTYYQARPKTKLMELGEIAQRRPEFRFFMPFVRTPLNMVQQTLERDTFYGLLNPSQRALLKSGTREGAMARGRLGLGFGMYVLAHLYVMTGNITGAEPIDPKLRAKLYATGWRPYSIRLPNGNYISYRGIYPFEQILGFAANSQHLLGDFLYNDDREKQTIKYVKEGAQTLTHLFLAPSGFLGAIEGFDTISKAISGEYDEALESRLANMARGFLPYSNLVKFGSDVIATEQTKPKEFDERFWNRYGNLGKGDYKRNVFGEVQNVYTNLLTKESESSNMVEDEEIQRLMEDSSFTPTQLKDGESGYTFQYSEFKSNSYDRSLYDLMQEQMSTTEIDGKTLREAVRELVTSTEYEELIDGSLEEAKENNLAQFKRTDNTKINAIKDIFDEYRAKAKKEVLEEYGDEFFDENGNSANEVKSIQDQNKMNSLLNQTIEDIRNYS